MKGMTKEITIFFADTYAIIEIIKGNGNYKKYLDNTLWTTKFNLAELYYSLLKDFGKDTADGYMKVYSKIIIPITYTSIKKGMVFKLENKEEKLSYTDCVGYSLAEELEVKFLTGDSKFENKKNVEFVK
jgi:uncharacterized protein